MKRWLPAILLGIIGASFWAMLASTSRSGRRIALIGDSYAVGLGPELARLLPDFKYEGHVGSSAAQWAANMPAWLASYRPSTVLVSLGVNDGVPVLANFQSIVRQLQALGADVVWIEPPAGVSVSWIGAVRRVISELGVRVIPATQTAMSGDGVHPASYGPWAREIAA